MALWLVNPHPLKGERSMAKTKRRRRRARRNQPVLNPRRRRRRAVSRFRGFRRNAPTHRRRGRRRHRRNPARRGFLAGTPPMQQTFMDVLWAGGGFIGTKFVGNMVMPAIGVTQPLARIAVKAGLAYGTAWGLSMMLGQRLFTPLLLGGMARLF